ncbi:hypothetical protein TIFTF001_024248 [Ficus carica]|uniref:Uncharacterized protein n=1 Tax=Ficus carica TaxID=3494 RepID=A0AA88AN08_FICCA|nr:hypothetical protein TIFTF001_024248 [Ficus carica]
MHWREMKMEETPATTFERLRLRQKKLKTTLMIICGSA